MRQFIFISTAVTTSSLWHVSVLGVVFSCTLLSQQLQYLKVIYYYFTLNRLESHLNRMEILLCPLNMFYHGQYLTVLDLFRQEHLDIYYVHCAPRATANHFLLFAVMFCWCVYRYEGTGRSLSLKLIQQLRAQCATMGNNSTEAVKAANMSDNNSSTSASTG